MSSPIPLPNLAYEVGNLRLGRQTPYKVNKFDIGELVPETTDVPQPRANGVRFGRDYYRGRLITFEGNIYTKKDAPGDQIAAPNALEDLVTAWSPEEVMMTPNEVIPLRIHRANRIRRVYGRPNRVQSTQGSYTRGWIPFVADFRCVDHLFYDDAENYEVVPFIPVSIGGLEGELIGDIIASAPGAGSGDITVRGTKPSWCITKINGPILNPVVHVTERWSYTLQTNILSDQWVTVDPTPWNRVVRRNDGANLSGAFTAQSARLSQMRLPPGYNQILLEGTDPTGTSSLEVFWRDTYGSY
jgi:hypothetical protein